MKNKNNNRSGETRKKPRKRRKTRMKYENDEKQKSLGFILNLKYKFLKYRFTLIFNNFQKSNNIILSLPNF